MPNLILPIKLQLHQYIHVKSQNVLHTMMEVQMPINVYCIYSIIIFIRLILKTLSDIAIRNFNVATLHHDENECSIGVYYKSAGLEATKTRYQQKYVKCS